MEDMKPDEVITLEIKIEELVRLNEFLKEQLRKYQKTMRRYQSVLEKYADKGNWNCCAGFFDAFTLCNGYELAQEVLKEGEK